MYQEELNKLNDLQRTFAEKYFYLIGSFLTNNKYNEAECFDVVAISYVKAIKRYYDDKVLRKKYKFTTYAWIRMKNGMREHHLQKRLEDEKVLYFNPFVLNNLRNAVDAKQSQAVSDRLLMLDVQARLSESEKEVLTLKMDGYKNAEIANSIGASPDNVKDMLRTIRHNLKDLLFNA